MEIFIILPMMFRAGIGSVKHSPIARFAMLRRYVIVGSVVVLGMIVIAPTIATAQQQQLPTVTITAPASTQPSSQPAQTTVTLSTAATPEQNKKLLDSLYGTQLGRIIQG